MASPVRVRFAPSPTGVFHVGGARTALWNWLFARQQGGVFVLRIEDTDEARNEEQWVEGIHSALRWLALDWDEEYRQSDQAAAHAAAAALLFGSGRAYYCDCTTEAVQGRKPAGAPPGYDGFCRDRGLDPAPGRALRFRVPPGRTVIDDVVRGRVEFDNDKLGGDFVVVKGNGGPIFYLANTVDDLDEHISHVLRAEEHLPNTPKNQLYLLKKAGILTPKTFKSPDDIDRLSIVKVTEKERPLERAFFFASSPEEFEKESKTSQRGLIILMLELLHHSIIEVSRRILHIGGSGDGEIESKQYRNHSWEHAHQGLHRNASVLLGMVSVSILP